MQDDAKLANAFKLWRQLLPHLTPKFRLSRGAENELTNSTRAMDKHKANHEIICKSFTIAFESLPQTPKGEQAVRPRELHDGACDLHLAKLGDFGGRLLCRRKYYDRWMDADTR